MLTVIVNDSILKLEIWENRGKLLSRWEKTETEASNGKREDS